MVEAGNFTLLKSVVERRAAHSQNFFFTGQEILATAKAQLGKIYNFKLGFSVDEKSLNNHQRQLVLNTDKMYDTESSFCTSNAIDAIFEIEGAREVYGASFVKPEMAESADLIFKRDNIVIVADGASMVVKPETNPDFPKIVLEKCMVGDKFMPDVLWSTMLANLIGKDNFKSPFKEDVKKSIESQSELNNLKEAIKKETDPEKIIKLINQGAGIFLKNYFGMEVNEDSKVFLPSGILGIVNLETKHWASVGDIRIGYTSGSKGQVKTVNQYDKVSNYDAAAIGTDTWLKEALASARTFEVGNLQGLQVDIESGVIPETVSSSRTNGKGAVVMWSDGEDMLDIANDQYDSFYGHNVRDPSISFTGTLIARNPFLYTLYLLHCQNRYKKNIDSENKFFNSSGHPSMRLKQIMKKPPWRADEASFVVVYE